MGEIIPSQSLSRVTYTGIKSMHSQKTNSPIYVVLERTDPERKPQQKKTHETGLSRVRKINPLNN